jgi:hypothetical protein
VRRRGGALIAVLALSLLAPAFARAQPVPNPDPSQIPVTGTVQNGGTFQGIFDLQRFQVVNGQLAALGTLTGTLTDAAGNALGSVQDVVVSLPVTQATGSCQILHLELGPLDLDLLGLVVHLDQVVLDITAQSGPGNLLGNLLCAVAHLLDGTGNSPLTAVVGLLNRILGALG